MHYHYQLILKRYITGGIFLFLSHFINPSVFAQDTTPQIPTLPTQTDQTPVLQGQKVDPSQVTNQQAVDFYNQAKSSGMSDMEIERAALQRGYTLDQISAMRKRLQQKPDEQQAADPMKKIIIQEIQPMQEELLAEDLTGHSVHLFSPAPLLLLNQI